MININDNRKTHNIQGSLMYLDKKDSLFLSKNKVYEPLTTKVLKELINEKDVILDMGANIGYYTLIFAKCTGNKGKVFAFEPQCDNFNILKQNVLLNGLSNVIVENYALSDIEQERNLFLCTANSAMHSIYPQDYCYSAVKTKCISIDDYFKDSQMEINFAKIDIEGAEYFAIKGMQSIINNNENIKLCIEFSPYCLKTAGIESKDLLYLLQNIGFYLYNIDEDKGCVYPLDINQTINTYTDEKENFTNILCIKNTCKNIYVK
ncbi:FkbM family methyltransferase [Candidatus Magnetoovum chiemensis]|nr:FkbM family methyltransferase [Candidatus Magnetoovum chiemensis]